MKKTVNVNNIQMSYNEKKTRPEFISDDTSPAGGSKTRNCRPTKATRALRRIWKTRKLDVTYLCCFLCLSTYLCVCECSTSVCCSLCLFIYLCVSKWAEKLIRIWKMGNKWILCYMFFSQYVLSAQRSWEGSVRGRFMLIYAVLRNAEKDLEDEEFVTFLCYFSDYMYFYVCLGYEMSLIICICLSYMLFLWLFVCLCVC